MNFYPISFHIDVESKSMFTHQFVNFIGNEHLFTGLISAIRIMYEELFKEELTIISMNNHSLLIQKVADFDIILLFHGENNEAEQLMIQIIEIMIEENMINYFNRSAMTSIIEQAISNRLEKRLRDEIPLNFNPVVT